MFYDVPNAEKWQPMQFVASIYDRFWWIGLILEVDWTDSRGGLG